MPALKPNQPPKDGSYCLVTAHYAQANGEPIVNAQVTIEPLTVSPMLNAVVQSRRSFDVRTDRSGALSFRLAPGRYRVVFDRDNKIIINVPAGRTTAVLNELVEEVKTNA